MKPVFGIFALSAMVAILGCIPDCTSEGYQQENREITLRLFTSIDSFTIRYQREGYAMVKVPVRKHRNDALGDTVICRFFGTEGRYRDYHLFSRVSVDSTGIRISHEPIGADRVDYRDSTGNIQVLTKQACSPLEPGFDADSIHIEMGGAKRIVFDTLTLRD